MRTLIGPEFLDFLFVTCRTRMSDQEPGRRRIVVPVLLHLELGDFFGYSGTPHVD